MMEPGSLADRMHAVMMRDPTQVLSAHDLAIKFDVDVRLVAKAFEEHAGYFVRSGTNWRVGNAPISQRPKPVVAEEATGTDLASAQAIGFDEVPLAFRVFSMAHECERFLDGKLTRPGLCVEDIGARYRQVMKKVLRRRHGMTDQRYEIRKTHADGRFNVYRLPDRQQKLRRVS